jgi:hypothetical protein
MHGERTARCPNCGGPIAFGLGSSAALVCPHCRYSVLRKGTDLQAIGRVADLVPTAPPISVGDSGFAAGRSFRVAGRMQLVHGSGPWDEWYLGFDDGSWGWLAQAQGRWYLTKPAEGAGLPPWQSMRPGVQGTLPPTGPTVWTVTEQGTSVVVSGEGELPFPIASGQQGWFVDVSGPGGAFGTVDYGDGSDPPRMYAGRELAPTDLKLEQGYGPRPEEKVAMGKVSCPSCGAPVELRSSDSERAACSYCYALLDVDKGNLQVIERLNQARQEPLIPLGTEGTLDGEQLMVIGYMERFTVVRGVTYAWREYLLYGPNGYRWLLEDSNHWTFLTPISAGDVTTLGRAARYEGTAYRRFSSNSVRVRFVVGEFYWKVSAGEEAIATDFVAPPKLISEERSDREIVWSKGRYVEPREIWSAFKLSGTPRRPDGIAPAQPNPHRIGTTLATFAVLALLLVALGAAFSFRRDAHALVSGPLTLPAQPSTPGAVRPPTTEDRASYTPAFEVTRGPTTLEVELRTDARNAWVGVDCALINENTAEVREFALEASYYSGYEGGESWSEGSRNASVYLEQIPSGTYTLRLDPQWTGSTATLGAAPPQAEIRVEQGKSSPWCCCFAFLLILAPLPLRIYRRGAFEKARWDNSN